MQNIRRNSFLRTVALVCSCIALNSCWLFHGWDHFPDIEAEFIVTNEADSPVTLFRCYYLSFPRETEATLQPGEQVVFERGLFFSKDTKTNEEMFVSVIVGDVRDDNYTEIRDSEGNVLVRWYPAEALEGFYSSANWNFFEERETMKRWTFVITNVLCGFDENTH